MEIEIFRPVRLFVGGAVLIFVLAEAFAGSGVTVTNEHVIQMLDAKLPTSLIIRTIESASCVKFDVSPEALIALKRAGAEDRLIEFVAKSAKVGISIEAVHTPANLPEKTEAAQLALRRFQTLLVDASKAEQFDTAGMKAALISAGGFGEFGITVVDDPVKAEAVLTFSCAAPGIFPFTLMHQKTKVMLLTGIGQGPSSNDPSTSDLAKRIVEELNLFRSSSLTTSSMAVPSSEAPPAIASSAAPRFLYGIKPGTKITLVSMNGLVHTGKMAMSSDPNRLSLTHHHDLTCH